MDVGSAAYYEPGTFACPSDTSAADEACIVPDPVRRYLNRRMSETAPGRCFQGWVDVFVLRRAG